jgi:hypothetical protein
MDLTLTGDQQDPLRSSPATPCTSTVSAVSDQGVPMRRTVLNEDHDSYRQTLRAFIEAEAVPHYPE